MKNRYLLALASAILLLLLPSICSAQAPAGLGGYVRYSKAKPASVSTAIVSMLGPGGEHLDLVAAVHLADAAYYQALNRQFKSYQVVLYELILPESMAGQKLPSQFDSGSGISQIQAVIASSMGLTTQLSKINYAAPNFVHADLTQEALSQAMANRQESLLTYLQNALTQANSQTASTSSLGVSEQELNQLNLIGLISGQPSAQDSKTLKKLMAATMTSPNGFLNQMENTAIIADRNQAALSVLQKQLRAGKRNLALFYGAAHMPDLQARLQKKGWKVTNTSWLKAWTI